jgi:hypothetical protein
MGERFHPDYSDPWRRRMWRAAERLRHLDEQQFRRQIATIEECLHRDATWNLEAALTCGTRWQQVPKQAAE